MGMYTFISLLLGIGFTVVAMALPFARPNTPKLVWEVLLWIGLLIIVGCILSVIYMNFYKKEGPDVTLHLVSTKSPALILDNHSSELAHEIKWAVALWNRDLPPSRNPLPIPVQTFDWIKPHESSGPLDLFNSPIVAPMLKSGNNIFGTVGISCPDCTRGRTFYVFIEFGKGGWFSEATQEKSGDLLVPKHFTQTEIDEYYQYILAIPEQSRIPIRDQ
jgi:hypothetical protein